MSGTSDGRGLALRPALVHEADALTALSTRSKAHWGYDAEFMRLSQAALTVRPERIAAGDVEVAMDREGTLLGFAAIASMAAPWDFDLEQLFVDPPAIGRGVGRALLGWAAHEAARRGGRRLLILADANAEQFYRRCGARFLRAAPSDAIPGRMLPLLELPLPLAERSTTHPAIPHDAPEGR